MGGGVRVARVAAVLDALLFVVMKLAAGHAKLVPWLVFVRRLAASHLPCPLASGESSLKPVQWRAGLHLRGRRAAVDVAAGVAPHLALEHRALLSRAVGR